MQVRYVQDARKRSVDLKKLLGCEAGVNLGVCKRFEELGSASGAPLDVLLIDASRSDRIALEDDIRTARQYTDAPIVFLTGGENGQIRARGLKAGAEAVLSRKVDHLHPHSGSRRAGRDKASRRRHEGEGRGEGGDRRFEGV